MRKLISWNVNGLRACVGKGFFDFLAAEQPDMMCLQETKLQPEQAPQIEGYYEYWNSAEKKGYSGVALFSKNEPQTEEQASLTTILVITPWSSQMAFTSCPPMSSRNAMSGPYRAAARS